MSPFYKSISVIFLTGLLLVRSLLVPAILMDFQLRKDYIITHLCENRTHPELHCDGRCYLAKKLKSAQESKEHEASQRLLTQLLEMPDQVSSWQFTFDPLFCEERLSRFPIPYHRFFPMVEKLRLFRPPQ